MSDDYEPFPEAELEAMCRDLAERGFPRHARVVRSALASYKALNERCLRAEFERDHGVTEEKPNAA